MLKEKVAIITGGIRGIGKAVAFVMAEQGAKVVTTFSKSDQEAEILRKEINELGYPITIEKCDVRDFARCEEFVKQVINEYGRIDILVNNAGVTQDRLLMNMTNEDFDTVIDVNLKGTFYMTKLVSRQMLKQRRGRIINMSSMSGVIGLAGQSNYAASKAGIIGFTKSAAKEFAFRNITVNAIAPGFILTEMNDRLSERIKVAAIEQIPLRCFGTAEDVAEVALFLASDKARYITGQVLHVDGGMAI